jgi:hypothetical protein
MKKFLFLNVFSVTFKLNTQCGERRISFLLFIIFIGSQIFTFNSKETRNNFEFRSGKNEIKMLLKFEKKIKQNIFFHGHFVNFKLTSNDVNIVLKNRRQRKVKRRRMKKAHIFSLFYLFAPLIEKVSFWIFALNDFLT